MPSPQVSPGMNDHDPAPAAALAEWIAPPARRAEAAALATTFARAAFAPEARAADYFTLFIRLLAERRSAHAKHSSC